MIELGGLLAVLVACIAAGIGYSQGRVSAQLLTVCMGAAVLWVGAMAAGEAAEVDRGRSRWDGRAVFAGTSLLVFAILLWRGWLPPSVWYEWIVFAFSWLPGVLAVFVWPKRREVK